MLNKELYNSRVRILKFTRNTRYFCLAMVVAAIIFKSQLTTAVSAKTAAVSVLLVILLSIIHKITSLKIAKQEIEEWWEKFYSLPVGSERSFFSDDSIVMLIFESILNSRKKTFEVVRKTEIQIKLRKVAKGGAYAKVRV
jgi:hypothetical protein